MPIAKKPRVEFDSSTTLGNSDFDYTIEDVDNGIQDYDVGESLLQFGQTNTDTFETHKMKMVCASFYIPKDNPDKPLGEDAHFFSEEKQTIGVADGVGGWAKKGVDAGDYARQLMSNASESVQNTCTRKRKAVDLDGDDVISPPVDPRKVLDEAYAKTKQNDALQGSSTACILSFDQGRRALNAANLGDSGFMVCSNNQVIFTSRTMQHRFNCPYQLGNGGGISDGPESAEWYDLEGILPGDIVVMGTDGLFDNMFKDEIEDALETSMKWRGDLFDDREYCGMVAEMLAQLALENSIDEDFESPFSKEAEKAGLDRMGGKSDDITVIVAQLVV